MMTTADSDDDWQHGWMGPLTGWSAGTVAILTLAVLLAVFKFFNMFINTVFWYFFNDAPAPEKGSVI